MAHKNIFIQLRCFQLKNFHGVCHQIWIFTKIKILSGVVTSSNNAQNGRKGVFEILPFTNMKVCLQRAVSKTWLYGVVVSFEILETFFSPGRYSANNAYDIQNTLEKLFSSDFSSHQRRTVKWLNLQLFWWHVQNELSPCYSLFLDWTTLHPQLFVVMHSLAHNYPL